MALGHVGKRLHSTADEVGGSRPRRNATDATDEASKAAGKLEHPPGNTGVTRCRPTNTSASRATSAWKRSRSSRTLRSPRANGVAASCARSFRPWELSLRAVAFTRTTVAAPQNLRPRRLPPRPRRRLRSRLRRRHQWLHQSPAHPRRPRIKSPILRSPRSQLTGRTHFRAATPRRCRRE